MRFGFKSGISKPPTCLCTTSNFFTNMMVIKVEMVVMVIMVIRTDRKTKTHGTDRTDRTNSNDI